MLRSTRHVSKSNHNAWRLTRVMWKVLNCQMRSLSYARYKACNLLDNVPLKRPAYMSSVGYLNYIPTSIIQNLCSVRWPNDLWTLPKRFCIFNSLAAIRIASEIIGLLEDPFNTSPVLLGNLLSALHLDRWSIHMGNSHNDMLMYHNLTYIHDTRPRLRRRRIRGCIASMISWQTNDWMVLMSK